MKIVYIGIFIILLAASCKQPKMKNEEAIYAETAAFLQACNKGAAKLVVAALYPVLNDSAIIK
jgi:hypothetical protein